VTTDANAVRAAALRLSPRSRAALAADLIESLDGPPEPAELVEAAWSDEIRRRLDEVDSGKVRTVSWSEARKRIAAAARRHAKPS
jgi:putative addiction module component (TIGR02574 family)